MLVVKGAMVTLLIVLAAAVSLKLIVLAADLSTDQTGTSLFFAVLCLVLSFLLCSIIAFITGGPK